MPPSLRSLVAALGATLALALTVSILAASEQHFYLAKYDPYHYHQAGCRLLRLGSTPITAAEVERLTACALCKPVIKAPAPVPPTRPLVPVGSSGQKEEQERFDKAAQAQRACDAGAADGCFNLGGMYYRGDGVPKDPAKAAQHYQRACDLGRAGCCTTLAWMYERGDGVPKNRAKAAELYSRACDAGWAAGCFNLGLRYAKGDEVPKNPAKAAQFYERGCDAGDAKGCSVLGLMYADGDGVPKNAAKAAELYARACDAGEADVCVYLGMKYAKGDGVPKDPAKAAQLFQRACDGGIADGCSVLGLMHADGDGVPKNPAKAVQFYERGCDAGDAKGCFNLGRMYGKGDGVPKNPAKAAQFYERACDAGFADGCFNLGVLYAAAEGVLQSGAAAADYYYKAGQKYLQDGEKADALTCVERIRNLSAVLGLTVPNAFLADQLMAEIYQGPGTPSERTRPTANVGTAWVVAGGLFVTCNHVVSETKLITLVLPGGARVKASIAVADESNDLALLRPESSLNLPRALPLAAVPARSGEQVFTVGYPHPDLLGGEAKATDGIVSATSGLQGDPRMYQISVPVQAGNSGGPLFNMRGEVVGIVVSKLNATKVFAWTGDLPENVNYAVKSSYVRPLLQSPDTQSGAAVGGADSLPNLVGRIRSSVALVLAE